MIDNTDYDDEDWTDKLYLVTVRDSDKRGFLVEVNGYDAYAFAKILDPEEEVGVDKYDDKVTLANDWENHNQLTVNMEMYHDVETLFLYIKVLEFFTRMRITSPLSEAGKPENPGIDYTEVPLATKERLLSKEKTAWQILTSLL